VWCSAAREINPTVFHALACDQLYKFYISSPGLISARVIEVDLLFGWLLANYSLISMKLSVYWKLSCMIANWEVIAVCFEEPISHYS